VKRLTRPALVLALLTLILSGCAPAPSQTTGPAGGAQQPVRQNRTLTMAVRDEVANLAPKVPGSSGPLITKRLFSAALSLIDGAGATQPYLAEALPQLNSDTWRVSPDGHMETTYRLRPNATWQDGTPLTADDFVFAYQVYREGPLGFIAAPEDRMEAVLAPDPRTVVVQWRSLYADAGILGFTGLVPLPKHALETAFAEYGQTGSREAFFGRPFWTVDYLGSGPYRLTRWEPGSFLEGEAFDGHILGRPKIDRLVLKVFNDENTVLASVLAGDQLDYTNQFSLRFEHIPTLRSQWEAAGKGMVMPYRTSAQTLIVQGRPEYQGDPALGAVQVRRAIVHAVDRPGVNEGVFEGIGYPTESFVPESEPMYGDVDRTMTKYPLDPRQAEQQMADAGFTKDSAGLFADGSGKRFRLDFVVSSGPENERVQTILSDYWKRAGFDTYASVLSQADARDISTRHTFAGLAQRGGAPDESHFVAAEIGSPANRWAGDNRGGWSFPEYERLFSGFQSSLDASERRNYSVQMLGLVSQQVPAFPLYFRVDVRTWVSSLSGPDIGVTGFGLVSQPTTVHWNIQNWEFR
jgi:peptide/nickel transport system substrate-binding protein